jgi:hypothetical protein
MGLAGYSFYKKGSIEATVAGAQTLYQLKLLVGESSGAVGEDVDCESHCQDFPNDIRFTAADGSTKHDYWIESVTGTTPNQLATIQIEVASIPASGAVDFYMYYGKSGDSGESNGANTFELFKGFGANTELAWLGGQYTDFHDGYVSQNRADNGDGAWNGVDISDGYVQADVRMVSDDGSANAHHAGIYFRICNNGTGYDNYVFMIDAFNNDIELVKQVAGVETQLGIVSETINYSQDYTLKAVFSGNSIICYVDGVEKINITDSSLSSGRSGLHIYDCSSEFRNFEAYDGANTFSDDFAYAHLLAGDNEMYSLPGQDDNYCLIENGVLKCIGNEDAHTILYYYAANFSDFILEATITPKEDPNAFGLSWRATDKSNYYGLMCRGLANDHLRSFKIVGDVFTALTQSAKVFSMDIPVKIKIIADGSSLKTYVDNVLYLTDTDSEFTSGKVGFYHYNTSEEYDDFRISKYASPEPTWGSWGSEMTSSITINSDNAPYILIYGTTEQVLAHLITQNVPTHKVKRIWNAATGPTNCVYLE